MKNNENSIVAVVVTHNRKKELIECLDAICLQTRLPNAIIVIDNASTCNIEELVNAHYLNKIFIIYKRLNKNFGGAGGFYHGLKIGFEYGYDWIWCMDDDVIPKPNALNDLIELKNHLIEAGEQEIGFICSRVISKSGKEMNVPVIDTQTKKLDYPSWPMYLKFSGIKVISSTFVSTMISRVAIEKVGLPLRKMFIWGDDAEYTARIHKYFPCFFSGKSLVIHNREIEQPLDIIEETNMTRISNYYFYYRNVYYIRKKTASIKVSFLAYLLAPFKLLIIFLRSKNKRILKVKIAFVGIIDSLFQNLENN